MLRASQNRQPPGSWLVLTVLLTGLEELCSGSGLVGGGAGGQVLLLGVSSPYGGPAPGSGRILVVFIPVLGYGRVQM